MRPGSEQRQSSLARLADWLLACLMEPGLWPVLLVSTVIFAGLMSAPLIFAYRSGSLLALGFVCSMFACGV